MDISDQRAPGFRGAHPLRTALDVIWGLTWRQFTPKSRREGFQLLWVFLEPVGQMVILILIFSLIGRVPGYGDSFALFLLTGIVMLTLFTNGSQLVKGAVVSLASPGRLAAQGMFHEAIARIFFKLIVAAIYTPILMIGVGILERVEVMPQNLLQFFGAFFWVGLMAFGVGLLRGYATLFAAPVERIYAILSRGLIFVSGVFFAPSFMPPQLRDWLAWNPLLHGVELMRLGVYAEYPTIVYAPDFLSGFAMGTTALGMALIWRRRAAIMG